MDVGVLFYFYLRGLKKIIPISLFIIICISHLNIIDVVIDVTATHKKENTQTPKNFPAEKESETEKENKGKEKTEEQEKYHTRTNYISTSQFQLSDKDNFICFTTKLNIHPYQDDDIQPPRAV